MRSALRYTQARHFHTNMVLIRDRKDGSAEDRAREGNSQGHEGEKYSDHPFFTTREVLWIARVIWTVKLDKVGILRFLAFSRLRHRRLRVLLNVSVCAVRQRGRNGVYILTKYVMVDLVVYLPRWQSAERACRGPGKSCSVLLSQSIMRVSQPRLW